MSDQKNKYRIGLAGSTPFTATLAKQLWSDDRYTICWVLSPDTKSVGRKHTLIDNHLHLWSVDHAIPSVRIANKIDQKVKQEIEALQIEVDVLLVVDFGYYVPQWLLELPKVAPLNLHPSMLPEWRGSSPGQAVLLSGAQTSAITLIQMDNQLDHGPIIHQESFTVDPSWTQVEYYQTAFATITPLICNLIEQFILANLVPTPQPATSPTPIARELTKADSFLTWELVVSLMQSDSKLPVDQFESQLPPFLAEMWQYLNTSPSVLNPVEFVARASRALSPWPQLWTLVPTIKGDRRLKILSVEQTATDRLILKQVQLEGQQPALWNQIKNSIRNQSRSHLDRDQSQP